MEIQEEEYLRFTTCISTELSSQQKEWIVKPEQQFPRQTSVLAVHWHPEYIPMELIRERIDAFYPHKKEALIIPTQHNQITEYGDYGGVEVDCYSRGFNLKVQLLLHFRKEKAQDATVFQNILKHTFTYRSSQLFNFLAALTKPDDDMLDWAARETGATEEVVAFACLQAERLERLFDVYFDSVPQFSIKNKLIRDYVDLMRGPGNQEFIDRVQTFLRAVKVKVKEAFPLNYFYQTSEVIEEARALGAGIIIPHPEQFWPVLLADYDVDGYEVWNPQSRKYTDFLITVLNRRNKAALHARPLLVFMGDDTHMSEKIKDPAVRDEVKACREIGLQPAWEDMQIRKHLLKAGMDRPQIIAEYKARLDS
ncbi:hypothetical protein JWJ90_12430 [Desulfobulbus rhabdoformis]|uniref:hypothetical protein n=1 Tax=Desulfobulbus rhabdoformis TaxID=34032 RepID=UPI0019668E67|nr:hypothetical protein [Desulfobulbus rhabdoformis]MBM9615084.1 hypothetical protein [Desulfobulbus rhabdoformis]